MSFCLSRFDCVYIINCPGLFTLNSSAPHEENTAQRPVPRLKSVQRAKGKNGELLAEFRNLSVMQLIPPLTSDYYTIIQNQRLVACCSCISSIWLQCCLCLSVPQYSVAEPGTHLSGFYFLVLNDFKVTYGRQNAGRDAELGCVFTALQCETFFKGFVCLFLSSFLGFMCPDLTRSYIFTDKAA